MNSRIALVLALVSVTSSCAPHMLIAAQYGPKTPEGDIGITSGGGSSNSQNSLDDLGLDDEADAVGLAGDFKWGLPHLTVAVEQASWDGSGTLSADYGGISANTPVDSEADLGLYRGILTFDLLPTDVFELGIGFGATLIDIDAEVAGGGTTEKVDEALPMPLLAVRGGLRVWRIDVQAVLAGMSLDSGGDHATYLEGNLSGRIAIFGEHGGVNGSLVLGWNHVDFEIEYEDGGDDVDADLSLDGPYFGLQIGI